MRRIVEVIANDPAPARGEATLTLAFDERKKSRQLVRLDSGEEAALFLPRGTVLKDGDRLRAEDGFMVTVIAAPETLSSVQTVDFMLLARAAYHLGNRHVPVEIAAGGVRYQHDHVLDGMVRALGMEVRTVQAPFQPEPGAYAHAGHGHHHDPDDDHGHHHHHHDHDDDHDGDHDH
jgi:urease accessory protein